MKRLVLYGIATVLLLAAGDAHALGPAKYCLRTQSGTDFLQVTPSDQPRAQGKACGPWETFTIEGDLRVGGKVALKSNFGKYLSAQSSGSLEGNRTAVGGWEQFVITVAGKQGGAAIGPGDKVHLRSFHGKWLQAAGAGGSGANATGAAPGPWETFVLVASGTGAPAPSKPDLVAKLKGHPQAASLLVALKRPEVKARLEAALGRVTAAEGKHGAALRKVASLVRNPAGLFGQWKTKQVCAPKEVTVSGTCKAYAQKCGKWGVPKCSSECAKKIWGKCVWWKKVNCTSPCARWDRTNTCLVWWPNKVTTKNVCSSVRYFDPTAGKIFKAAEREAHKALEKAKAAFNAAISSITTAVAGVIGQLTKAIQGYIRNPRSLADVVARVPPFLRNLFPRIFEMAGDAMLKLMQQLMKKWVASQAMPASTLHAWLPRRRPAPMCSSLIDDPVKQIRTSMATSATGLLLVASGKLKANYMKFGKNATMMSWHWRPGGAGRAQVSRLMSKFGDAMARLKYFVRIPKAGQTISYFGASSAQAPKPGAVKPPPPAGGWKAGFKKAVMKGALPMGLVAIQWAAVAAAGPFSHGRCHERLVGTQEGMRAYQQCFRAHYLAWSRTTLFDALVGTAVGALGPVTEKIAMALSGAIAAAVISSFPAAAPWLLPTAAVIGMAMNVAAIIGLTALADKLIPWYLATFWPQASNNPGAGNVKKFFAERADEGAATFPKTWYADKYYVDESKTPGGAGRCTANIHCTGTRQCRSGYCWIDETKNASGAHRCRQDTECASPRVCTGQGGRSGAAGFCNAPSASNAGRRPNPRPTLAPSSTPTPTPTPAPRPTPALSGIYQLECKHGGGQFVTQVGAGYGSGTNVARERAKGWNTQKWKLHPVGGGFFKIEISHGGNRFLSQAGAGYENGANVVVERWKGWNTQTWKLHPAGGGYYKIEVKHGGNRFLTAVGAGYQRGTNIVVERWKGSNTQLWKLVRGPAK